jgi:SAM-dependent methyltransferase
MVYATSAYARRMTRDPWVSGEPYERFMGRWSRRMSRAFVAWLEPAEGLRWLDVGCGTGALTAAVLEVTDPTGVVGVDPSEGFLETARAQTDDPRARFEIGDAMRFGFPDGEFDAVVSGLVLNFVPDPATAAAEIVRVAAPGGTVAAYVWDYASGMELLRHFWDAATALDPDAAALDEGRLPLCRPERLRELWHVAGLADVVVEPLEMPTIFTDFDDYWTPFLGGPGPAGGYAVSRTDDQRAELRELLRSRLPTEPDGSIPLVARAWAVRGRRDVRPTGEVRPTGPA